jgi:FAD/FMN-containing dehydrogenase/Fe-S oxidoreductase
MISAQQKSTLTGSNCIVAFDNLTLQLYATDASPYRIEPVAVGFPRNARQTSALVQAATQAAVSIIPRGAGTGLAGGAIGDGLVIDLARFNRKISDFDRDRRSVRVGAGVVLDQLNDFLRPHGFCFGPDVATSSRATLGGMIANDSSGAYTPYYGTTSAHVNELEIVTADGTIETVGPSSQGMAHQRELIRDVVYFHSLEIGERMAPGLLKRRPGYALDRCARQPNNLAHVICGSEGTLAIVTAAELKVVKIPARRGLGLLFFSSIAEAMQASVELLELKPAAVEHLDRVLLDQTAGRFEYRAARSLLDLDRQPCQSILVVEFFDNIDDKLAMFSRSNWGSRRMIIRSEADAALVWGLRKAGLALLTGCKGDAKPVTCIEDTAVRPKDLPAYYEGLQSIISRLGLRATYYGHAAAGLLHVRPILDMHSAADLKKFRQVAMEVSALVRQFGGSLAGEHGVGIARTEFMAEQVGEPLLEAMREVKAAFDPNNLFNPGKIISDGRFRIDENLRITAGRELKLPFEPELAFAAKDESFIRNLEQCNGCGGCRKETPTMCPTFIATGEEAMSTRGRANIIRAMLEMRGLSEGQDPMRSRELEAVLSSCLGCKACVSECPSNVDLTLLKAELTGARIRRDGLGLRRRVFSAVDFIGRVGCAMPRVANFALGSRLGRFILNRILGLAWQRPLPRFASQRFDEWFCHRPPREGAAPRGRVVLWDDTFVRYHEPHIGSAAVKVLEAAGYAVTLAGGRLCCGRPAFSQGNLQEARRLGRHNIEILSRDTDAAPIIFLEPSCYSMFVQDYRELNIPGADATARRCFLFEQFIEGLLGQVPDALKFTAKHARVVVHAHCHVRGLMEVKGLQRLARRLPQREAKLLDTGCCGMAGAFGMKAEKYSLSLKIAEPIAQKLRAQPYGTVVVASGTSCRQQLAHIAPVRPRHMAEILAEALEAESPGPAVEGGALKPVASS